MIFKKIDLNNSASYKPVNFIARLTRIWPYFRQSRGTVVLIVIATAISSATEPLIPALLQPLLDSGFQRGEINLWVIPVALLTLFGIRGLAGFIAQWAAAHVMNQGLNKLRTALFDKILSARLSLFISQSSSSLTNTVVYEVQNGAQLLLNSLMTLARDSLTLLALVSYLLFINWKLTLIVGCLFPAVALVMRILSRRLYRLTRENQSATDALAYVVEENVLAHRDIRLHAAQSAQSSRFSRFSQSLYSLSMKSTAASSAMTPITQMLAAVALSAVISVALHQSTVDGTSVGGFVAFVTAMLMLVSPIKHLSEIASPITRGLAAIEKGLDLIQSNLDEETGTFSKDRAQGRITFVDTTVAYQTEGPPALDGLNLTIEPGELLALVGGSGAGKTTLANLLPRFVEPTGGHIELDGHDLRDWQLESLREQFAFVSQHVVMLNDTLAANVALGVDIDRKRVLSCLSAANLETFVAELPSGIDTVAGHNAMKLSGGQRQRLAIARALYKDAPILILDEATSALDADSERAVQEALKRLMFGRTSIVVAHRLSTVHHAHRIVVMDSGRVVEKGTHKELIKKNGQYARLYALGLHDELASEPILSKELKTE